MKKVFPVAAVILLSSLSSCVKSWSCNCVQTIPSTNGGLPKTERFYVPVSGTKNDAKKQCDAGDTPADWYGDSSIECTVGD